VGDDVPINREAFLMINFVNFKLKSAQSFKNTYRDRMCVCVYRSEYLYIYEYMYLYYVSKKTYNMVGNQLH
jgi:hypothetical protein